MAKKRHARDPRRSSPGWLGALLGLSDVLAHLADRFGWPGMLLILGYVFVELHGTPEQKQEIIDHYVLFKGATDNKIAMLVAALATIIIVAQHFYYRRRINTDKKELERLGKAKSSEQRARLT